MHPSGCYHPALQLRKLQLPGQTACLAALLVQAAGRCLPAAPAAGSCAAAGVSGDQALHVASWQPADLHCSQQHFCTLPHGTWHRTAGDTTPSLALLMHAFHCGIPQPQVDKGIPRQSDVHSDPLSGFSRAGVHKDSTHLEGPEARAETHLLARDPGHAFS